MVLLQWMSLLLLVSFLLFTFENLIYSLGTSIAFFFSIASIVYSICHPTHPTPVVYFETCTTLISFITLGRYFENVAKGKTSDAVSNLLSLKPTHATLAVEDSIGAITEEKQIPSEYIQVGDLLKIVPGVRIPTDGIVESGVSSVDESILTGESRPVRKSMGDSVIGGTLNTTGCIYVRAVKIGTDTTLAHIIKLVNEAQTSKAPIQEFADKIAAIFVPAIISLGVATFVSWLVIFYIFGLKFESVFPLGEPRFVSALNFCISVIVVACPCALGLATPTAVMVGTGVGAKLGLFIKGGASLERASKLTTVVFDKTGTLTTGRLEVVELNSFGYMDQKDLVAIIGSAEASSEHPLGRALVKYSRFYLRLGDNDVLPFEVKDFQAVPGQGILCTVNAPKPVDVLIGNRALFEEKKVFLDKAVSLQMNDFESKGFTVVLCALDKTLACIIALSDCLKADSALVVKSLRDMKLDVVMITGDQEKTARVIASECGISRIYAGISPAGKKTIVENMQRNGEIVAMVGDGVNDSASLVQADLGIAVYGGSDVAAEAANIVLMKDDIVDVVNAIDLSKAIFRRIKLNFVWASL